MQVKEREEQLRILSDSYIQLKSDFEYNVKLLDSRDAELAKREADLAESGRQLQVQSALHQQMQEDLARAREGGCLH